MDALLPDAFEAKMERGAQRVARECLYAVQRQASCFHEQAWPVSDQHIAAAPQPAMPQNALTSAPSSRCPQGAVLD